PTPASSACGRRTRGRTLRLHLISGRRRRRRRRRRKKIRK
ncbi:hypothetical protein LINPERHAP1_LOCUS14964, partial [Linum perenne]